MWRYQWPSDKFHSIFKKFMRRAIKCRVRVKHPSISLADSRRRPNTLPPQRRKGPWIPQRGTGNRRLGLIGVWADSAPSWIFWTAEKMTAGINLKLSVPYPASTWLLPYNFEKKTRHFWENSVLVTSCFAILGKNVKCSTDDRMYILKVNKTKNVKRCKIELSNNWASRIFDFLFGPKIQSFESLRRNAN